MGNTPSLEINGVDQLDDGMSDLVQVPFGHRRRLHFDETVERLRGMLGRPISITMACSEGAHFHESILEFVAEPDANMRRWSIRIDINHIRLSELAPIRYDARQHARQYWNIQPSDNDRSQSNRPMALSTIHESTETGSAASWEPAPHD